MTETTCISHLMLRSNNSQIFECIKMKKHNVPFSKLNMDNKNNKIFDTILIFNNRWDGNFRHFMVETLHLLSFLFTDDFNKKYNENNFRILMVKDYIKHNYEILEILNLTKYISFIDHNSVFKSNHLIFSKKKVPARDYYKIPHLLKLKETLIGINHLNRLLTLLSRDIDDFPKTPGGEIKTPKRWITNQKDVVDIILEHGYKKTRVDNLHMRDQIALINSAKKIITFIGANCDNSLFANKSCIFNILHSKSQVPWYKCINDSNTRSLLCSKRDNDVLYNPLWGSEDPFNGPYKVDLNLLKSLIN